MVIVSLAESTPVAAIAWINIVMGGNLRFAAVAVDDLFEKEDCGLRFIQACCVT